MKANFTEKWVAAQQPQDKRVEIWDTKTPGLRIRIEPSGAKSFSWFRSVNNKSINKFLAKWQPGVYTVEDARADANAQTTLANNWRRAGYRGPSPFDRDVSAKYTLRNAFDVYLERRIKEHSKNPVRAARDTQWAFDKYIPEKLAARPLAEITWEEIWNLHDTIGKENGRYSANRALELLAAVFNFAIDKTEKFSGVNPCKKVDPFKESKRTVFVQKADLKDFLAALALEAKDNRTLHDCVWLALLCGIRRGDLFSVRWSDLDLAGGNWLIPNPKSGVPYSVPLSPEAIEVFKSRKSIVGDSPFVFPSESASGHLEDIKKAWETFRKKAGHPGLRFHDLRRTFASHAIQNGVPLFTVSKMLGHTSGARVTEAYAHLVADNVRAGVATATKALLS